MSFQDTSTMQAEGDALKNFLTKCLTPQEATEVKNKLDQKGIDYNKLLKLPEKYLNQTLEKLNVEPWLIGPIVDELGTIETSSVYKGLSSPSSVVVLSSKQNEFVLSLHKNTEIIKKNINKLLKNEKEIHLNSKTIISDINKYYNHLSNILIKQKEKTLKKLDIIKNNKLKITKKEIISANQALDCLKQINNKLNKIISNNKLNITKKQISITKHIESSQQSIIIHKQYLKDNMVFKTQPKIIYQAKDQSVFQKYISNIDNVSDADISFNKIKFVYNKAIIKWKCDLVDLNKNIKYNLQFKEVKNDNNNNQWKLLKELKPNQTKFNLDNDKDDDKNNDDGDDDDNKDDLDDQDEIEFYDDDDDDNDDNKSDENKGKAGLLTGLTAYKFRILMTNNVCSKIITIKTPRFKRLTTNLITTAEDIQLMKWITNASCCNFKLLFRGSTDGFAASTFHTKCNNKGPTLTIIRSTNNHIFGGYCERSWNSSGSYQSDDNAWLYLLRSAKCDNPQVFRAKPGSNALHCQSSYGPTYGDGHDLYLTNNCNSNNSSYSAQCSSYATRTDNTQLAGSYNFTVTDYEVWQINDPKYHPMKSTILKRQEFQILNEWVLASGKSRRQYKLLFRASRDGFASSVFHSKCDGQGTTLVVAQSEHNHVFGGYTEASWKHAGWVHNNTATAWIYLLRSSKNDKPEKWTPTKSPGHAIYAVNSYGPAFGGGHDLCLSSGCDSNNSSYSNLGHSYSTDLNKTKLAGSYNFKVTDYEVWHVF